MEQPAQIYVEPVETLRARRVATAPAARPRRLAGGAAPGRPARGAQAGPVVGGASRNTYKIERPEQGQRLARRLLAGDGGPPEERALVLEEFLQGRPSLPHGDYVSVAAAGVVFAYNNLPPLEATRLEAISGAAAVRALPEVVRYLPILRPGDGIDNAAATNELDLLLGRAAGHQEMLRVVDQALGRLTFTFTLADGRRKAVPARRAGR